jgi:hypothetical protein
LRLTRRPDRQNPAVVLRHDVSSLTVRLDTIDRTRSPFDIGFDGLARLPLSGPVSGREPQTSMRQTHHFEMDTPPRAELVYGSVHGASARSAGISAGSARPRGFASGRLAAAVDGKYRELLLEILALTRGTLRTGVTRAQL